MKAEAGESLYNFVQRALENISAPEMTITHNDVSVRIYYNSFEYDVLDKFEMQRKINELEK